MMVSVTSAFAASDWRKDREEHLNMCREIAGGLLLAPPNDPQGARDWTKFLTLLQSELEDLDFNVNDAEDEKYWNSILGIAMTYFSVVCDSLPEREKIAYDLTLLRKGFLDYHAGWSPKRPSRWEDVRSSLGEGELAVEITAIPWEILVLGNDFERPLAIPIDETLLDLIDTYSPVDPIAINAFYQPEGPLSKLMALLEPYLKGMDTLYISGSNEFAVFNYGAAPVGEGPLRDRLRVVQMSSTADIPQVKASRKPTDLTAKLWGGIDYGSVGCSGVRKPEVDLTRELADLRKGVAPLPESKTEVEKIARILRDSIKGLYTGDAADEKSAKAMDREKVTVIHFATHGYYLPEDTISTDNGTNRPLQDGTRLGTILSRSGLLMAGANNTLRRGVIGGDDGILTAGEIVRLHLRDVDLAVLSACSTGDGDRGNLTGVIYGVANAFKTAGVRQVLMTLWDIPDSTTAIGMEAFYEALAQGHDPETALDHLRSRLADLGYTSPYYQAPFVLLR